MKNNFGLFFRRDDLVVRLPVNPDKLPESGGADNEEYNVLGIGPIMVPRTPALRKVRISCFFPGRPFAGVLNAGGFQPPAFYIDFFRRAMTDLAPVFYTPVRYYENGQPFMEEDQGFMALVTTFDVEERGGETGDFYYELELTEYKDYTPQTVRIQQAAAGKPAQASAKKNRPVPAKQLYAGCTAIANGNYYYTSYGQEPHGTANGRRVKVQRIVDSPRACPVHITTEGGSALGWIKAAALQVVEEKG